MRISTGKTAVGVVLLLGVVLLGALLLFSSTSLKTESQLARQARADLVGLTGPERDEYISEEAAEFEMHQAMGDLFAIRASYPTGYYDPAWLLAAAEVDKTIPEGVPAGDVAYSRSAQSPLTLDPNEFTFLGPEPLQMNGCQNCFPYGEAAGRTNVIISDPVSPTIAYAGSDGGGVWKTTNCCGADTVWTPITDDPLLTSIAIGDLLLDPNDHNTIYAGTGDLRYGSWSFGSAGLLKSSDGGATWEIKGADVFSPVYPQAAGEFPQYQAIGKVQVDPRDSDNVIVGTKTGLYFSYDAGDTWEGPCYTNNFLDQRQDITGLLIRDDVSQTTLYAAVGTRGFATAVQPDLNNTGANGVYSTTVPTSGCPAAWNLLNNGWPTGTGDGVPGNDQVGRIDMGISPSNPDVIYAQVADNTDSGGTLGVWRTVDGGNNWTQQATPADFLSCTSGIGQTWYNAGVSVDPNNPDVVFLSMIDIYRSTNGGDTFNNLTCGYNGGFEVHVDNHARAFVGNSSSTMLAGSDGGTYVTHNADAADPNDVTFINLNDTLGTIEFYGGDVTANFATSAEPGINAGAQDNGSAVYVWTGDPGPAMWQLRTGGDGMYARIEPVLGQRWYQESQNGNVKVSTTGPFGPFLVASGAWAGDRRSFIFPYDMAWANCPATGCTHMIAGSYRVWETVQGAVPSSSWYVNSPDLTKGTLADRSFIEQLHYSVSDETIAIAGTLDGNVYYGFNMGQGVANSATWVNVTGSNTVLPNRPIMNVATDPLIPTVGYAALGGFDENTPGQPGHVYQVTCTANCSSFTWVDKSGNLPNVPINAIIVNPNWPQQVFAGSDWGLYYTDNIDEASPTWQKFTAGLPNAMIWELRVDYGATALVVFTRSRGAYAWPLPVGPNYNVVVSNSTASGMPGSEATQTFVVSNTGSEDDAYTLALIPDDWALTLVTASPLSVTAGMTATVEVLVSIPADAVSTDTDSFLLTVTSLGEPSLSDSGVGTTAVSGTADIEVSGDTSGVGLTGETITYTLLVTNTGTVTDTFTVATGASAWAVSAGTLPTLAPGASAALTVTVTIGSGAADSVDVTLTSTFDTAVATTVTLETSNSQTSSYQLYLPVILSPES
ncbi:MAG: hypothetical protein KC443_07180 [Anaerolineales bacterium]|nr:hypothetical protein [Anaerolineales bacterium]